MKTGWIIGIIFIVLVVGLGVFFLRSGSNTYTQQNSNVNNPMSGGNSAGSETTNPNVPPMPSNPTSTKNIEISNFAFSPTTLTINKGDTIIWTNKDSASHTVTSDSGTELSSGTLSNGQTYSHTFSNSGTYNYHCNFHGMMKGTIIVK